MSGFRASSIRLRAPPIALALRPGVCILCSAFPSPTRPPRTRRASHVAGLTYLLVLEGDKPTAEVLARMKELDLNGITTDPTDLPPDTPNEVINNGFAVHSLQSCLPEHPLEVFTNPYCRARAPTRQELTPSVISILTAFFPVRRDGHEFVQPCCNYWAKLAMLADRSALVHRIRCVDSVVRCIRKSADVYDGEMHGLEMAAGPALAYAAALPMRQAHVYFFADNNSAITQICEQRPAACQAFSVGFMRRVEEFLLQDDSHRVTVAWVPGHEDIAGQEASDQLAKAGTRRASSLRFSTTITRARRSNTERLLARWQERWAGNARNNAYEPANRIPPSLRPTQQLRKYDKKTFSALVQCRTGHAHTGEYYRSIRKPERGFACPCGEALQTRDHVLVECPQYERHRRVLMDVSPTLQVPELLGTKAGIHATAAFLRRSGAFGRPTTEVEDVAGD